MTSAAPEVSGSTAADAPTPKATDATTDPGHHVRKGLALALLCGAQLMIVLDATIVNIALPHIKTALGFSDTSLSWVMNAYTLTFGGLLLLGGRLGDLIGRRRMFVTGLTVFTFASLLGGFAQNSAMLLSSRSLQGVGGALVAPAVLSLVTTLFREGPERNKALGVYAAVSGGGSAVGLLAGGILTEYLSWRWVLFVNVPIGAALVAAIPLAIPEDARRQAGSLLGRLDIPGALTSTIGVTSLVYGVIHAASNSWTDTTTVTALVVAVVLLTVFVLIELRSERPLMPMRMFANRNRSGSYVVMMLAGAGMMAAFYFITIFMQDILGYKALRAGVSYLPLCAGVIVAAQFTSVMLPRIGPRVLLTGGAALTSASLFYLTFLDENSGYAVHLLPSMIGIGLGMGTVFVAIMATAVSGIAPQDAGIGSAMLNVTQQIGGTIGLSAMVTVLATTSKNYITDQAHQHPAAFHGGVPKTVQNHAETLGTTAALTVGAVLLAIAALTALTVLRVPKSTGTDADADAEAQPVAVAH